MEVAASTCSKTLILGTAVGHGANEDARRAWAMVACARRAVGDEPGVLQATSRAASLFEQLRKNWAEVDTKRYLTRDDVAWLRRMLP